MAPLDARPEETRPRAAGRCRSVGPQSAWGRACRIAAAWVAAVVIGAVCAPALRASGPDPATPPVVSAIEIEILGMDGAPSDRLATMARGMMRLREGEPFSEEKLQQTLTLLKSSGLFKAIDLPDPAWRGPEMALAFRLTPFKRIKDIRIHGAFPLLQKEVLNAMTIYTGAAYVPGQLDAQAPLIARAFKNDGYPSAVVRVGAEEDPKDGALVVTVAIDKGKFDRIKRVELHGNRAFSDTRLKLRLHTWKASLFAGEIPRFIEKEITEDAKNLTRFYQRKGYPEVKIASAVEKRPGTHEVILRFTITEGPHYSVRFTGNDAFWSRTLKKEMALSTGGNAEDLGLTRSIRNIRTRYREAGYPQTRVRVEETRSEETPPEKRALQLTISEGPRSVVGSITFQGNTLFDADKLRKQMLTRPPGTFGGGGFVPETLTEDIRAIQSLYLKQGYLSTSITPTVTWRKEKETGVNLADLVLSISEGAQTRVAAIAITGLHALPEASARKALALSKGAPFRAYMVQSDENTLSQLISEKGYPHVTVTGKVTRTTGSHGASLALVTYQVAEGPRVMTGEILYTGNFRTRESVFKREVGLAPDDPFSLTKMLETQRNLRDINALNAAHFKTLGLEEKMDRVNLLVEVEEKKPYYLEFGAGYDTRRKIYAHTRLGDHNLFGLNKDGWVASEWSEIGYRNELGITEPRFLGTRISSTFSMFGEDLHEFNQDFGIRTYGASLAFNRSLPHHLTAALATRFERREQYPRDADPIALADTDQFEPRSILVTTPTLTYNSTDSFTRPRKGAMASGSADISKGLGNSLDDFVKYRCELRGYLSPLERLTFALRGRYQHIAPTGSNDTIPKDQRLFLGGTSDVRGFSENMLLFDASGDPVGGLSSFLGSAEARVDLGLNAELTAFYDTGSVRDVVQPGLSEAFRSSAGIGLRYVTPIGPIGFLYGRKLDRKPGESLGNIHFSIGYTF